MSLAPEARSGRGHIQLCRGGRVDQEGLCGVAEAASPREGLRSPWGPKSHPPCTVSSPAERLQLLPSPASGKSTRDKCNRDARWPRTGRPGSNLPRSRARTLRSLRALLAPHRGASHSLGASENRTSHPATAAGMEQGPQCPGCKAGQSRLCADLLGFPLCVRLSGQHCLSPKQPKQPASGLYPPSHL